MTKNEIGFIQALSLKSPDTFMVFKKLLKYIIFLDRSCPFPQVPLNLANTKKSFVRSLSMTAGKQNEFHL